MPSTCCSVPGCANRGGHEFPADKDRQKTWVIAIRRDENSHGKAWRPHSSSAVVCRSHFTDEDYQGTNLRGFKSHCKRLKPSAIPSQFHWTAEPSATSEARKQRGSKRAAKRKLSVSMTEEVEQPICIAEDEIIIGNVEEVIDSHTAMSSDAGVQCEPVVVNTETQTQAMPTNNHQSPGMSVHEYRNNPVAIQLYTGLTDYALFMEVLVCLGPAAHHLKYFYAKPILTVENQLFMTLMKLRTYRTNLEISLDFKISEMEVYNVFITWVKFMALQWREIDIWPDRDIVRYFSPSNFRSRFPRTRAIFDGTECPVKKPKASRAQQVTYSTYKNRNTAKVLIGITPGGLVSYVSPTYAGSTSDRQIVERSPLTILCDPGDSIMADKGFDVQDLFAPNDVTVNIPTFFKKKNRMCGKTVLRDRAISSKRVHVERIIGLGKTYKILCHPLNHTEMVMASDILFVCYMLVNLRACIVPRNA